MAQKKNDLGLYFIQMPGVKKYWGWFCAMGLLLIALGALAVGYAKWATEFTVIVLGVLLAGSGIVQIASGIYANKWTGYSVSLLLGLLYIVAGGMCIFKPMQSATGIGLLIAAVLLVGGAFRLVSALRYRFDHWPLVAFSGIISIGLGVLILAEWPQDALWVIGLFVGIDLILVGSYWVGLGLAAKKS